jgi:hypothetical protein
MGEDASVRADRRHTRAYGDGEDGQSYDFRKELQNKSTQRAWSQLRQLGLGEESDGGQLSGDCGS